MRSYSIQRHAKGHLVAVGDGWSWPAFLYGIFWALYQRNWVVAGCCMAPLLACAVLEPLSPWFASWLNFWFSSLGFMIAVAWG